MQEVIMPAQNCYQDAYAEQMKIDILIHSVLGPATVQNVKAAASTL